MSNESQRFHYIISLSESLNVLTTLNITKKCHKLYGATEMCIWFHFNTFNENEIEYQHWHCNEHFHKYFSNIMLQSIFYAFAPFFFKHNFFPFNISYII